MSGHGSSAPRTVTAGRARRIACDFARGQVGMSGLNSTDRASASGVVPPARLVEASDDPNVPDQVNFGSAAGVGSISDRLCGSRRRNPGNRLLNFVQGNSPWDQSGSSTWNPDNIQSLCRNTSKPAEPGWCFDRLMSGGVNWAAAPSGNGKTRWTFAEGLMTPTQWSPASRTRSLAAPAGNRQSPGAIRE